MVIMATEKEIFHITGADRRREVLDAVDKVIAQATGGKDIEYFSQETGFVLLRKDRSYSVDTMPLTRVRAVCDLSLNNPKMGLRDGYYTLRMTPNLVEPFKSTDNIYGAYLDAINTTEVICDLERDVFVEGRQPKGMIFYPFHRTFGNVDKPIGFTENIAREVLEDADIEHAQNIIAVEKLASELPLADSKFPKLTNSVLVTTGGFYTRGIEQLISRFIDSKQTLLWTDGDVWGVYMREVIKLGSMASRHLDNKLRHPSIINAGLRPSVAKDLNLPNDTEEKRPLESKEARERIELLKMIGFPEEDVKTFENNWTFELEALNVAFRNKRNEPVGQALYLAKLMELRNLEVKPIPSWDGSSLQEDAEQTVADGTYAAIRRSLSFSDDLKDVITEAVSKRIDALTEMAVSDAIDGVREKLNLTREETLAVIYDYYVGDMENRESIDKEYIIRKSYGVEVTTDPVNTEAMREELASKVEEILDGLNIQVTITPKDVSIPKATKNDLYQTIYKELGVKPSDERKMDAALRKSLEMV